MALHPDTQIGHVHLTVSDLGRSVKFYRDVLGFKVMSNYGDSAVFLSVGGYHHHIGLNMWAGKGAPEPPSGSTGLYHFAALFPSRKELAKAVKRLLEEKHPIESASGHGVSEAIYLHDPDNIGIEPYADRPRDTWPKGADGKLIMGPPAPLNIANLLSELLFSVAEDLGRKPGDEGAENTLSLSKGYKRYHAREGVEFHHG